MAKPDYKEIETERLFLRRLKQSDWEIISYLRSDKTVNKFVRRPNAETKEKALDFIKKINDNIDNQKSFYWCLSKNDNSKMIGSICLWNFSKNRKTAEIGYDLNPDFQGKGIMNEALKEIVEFGFKNLNLDLIEAYTHHNNESSKKLLERNKFILIKGEKDENNEDNIIYKLKKASN